MTSAFHRPRDVKQRAITWRLHPALSDVLNRLEGTDRGQSFRDRAIQVASSTFFSDPVDYGAALTAHRWVLERAAGDGLPLTAAGYLTPTDVRELAAVLPTTRDWPFGMAREIDVRPVLYFRDSMKSLGLVRKYKASLRLTKPGREALADVSALWLHLADTLVPGGSRFHTDAAVVILVHAATTDGTVDVDEVALTLTALGWSHSGGAAVGIGDVYDVWNDLWDTIGNVGASHGSLFDRTLSPAARILIHDALFEEVDSDSAE